MRIACFLLLFAVAVTSTSFAEEEAAPLPKYGPPVLDLSSPGGKIYTQRCAACHDKGASRAPPSIAMIVWPPEYVQRALTAGAMKEQAAGLTAEQIRDVSTFLTAKPFGTIAEPDPEANRCSARPAPLRLGESDWNGGGRDLDNTRYQPRPGFTAADVPRLKVKWAFAYPGQSAWGQPALVGDRLYVNSIMGRVYSLDARTGCTHWSFLAESGVKAAISVGPTGKSKFAAYVGDEKAFVYALDADTGAQLWRTRVDEHPLALITGAPRLYQGRLYVPVASQEELASRDDNYVCCTFRGSIVALDAITGKILWKTYTIDQAPKPFRKTASGRDFFGPAGGGIWNSPAIDPKRKRLYVGTGNSYVEHETDATDSILALDLETGARVWSKQASANDHWNTACWEPKAVNCPKAEGPDDDFGGPPVLRTLANGKQILVAGQKSGTVFGLDPDNRGAILWKMKRPDRYGTGGVIQGVAADATAVYAPFSMETGLTAFELSTGAELWHVPAPQKAVCGWGAIVCTSTQPAALAIIPGVVFSGSTDGHMRAFAAKDGTLIWDFDTAARPYDAVNGVKAFGGGIGGAPQIVANGFLYVNSGYSYARAGNALLAFTVDGK